MTVINESNRISDILKFELENNHSREVVTVLPPAVLAIGAVIGKILLGACPTTGTKAEDNTGSGTCTSVTAGQKAKVGTYTLKCLIAQAGYGVFTVEDPDGYALPNAIVGTAYTNDQINFTLNDGSPDFAVGDSFTITIPEGSGSVKPIDFTAVDGSQNAHGFSYGAYDATSAALSGVAIVRDAQIITANLVWPEGATTAQKTAALAQLAEKGIVARTEA